MKNIILTTFATLILSLSAFGQASDLLSPTARTAFENEDFAPCVAEMTKLIGLKPKNDAALVERARCLFLSSNDIGDVEKIFSEKSKTIADKELAGKAVDTEVISRRQKAIEDATQAIAINPQNAAAFNIRGLVKSSLGLKEKAEAIADFDKAIEIDPKFIKPYINRGNSKVKKNDIEGAIADFKKVLEIDPNNSFAAEQISSLTQSGVRKDGVSNNTIAKNQCVSGNCINGKGKMITAYGYIYEGDFVNGKREGQGTFDFRDGRVYTGQFSNDEFHGKGKFNYGKYDNGKIYEGDWLAGNVTGKGKETYSNGDFYEGDFVAGTRHGKGKYYKKATDITQEGTFNDGVYAGTNAVITALKQDQCVSGNCVNGKGKMVYGVNRSIDDILLVYVSAGDTYEGDFVNGKRQGKGILTGKDGDVYEGDWVNDFQKGEGTLTYKNGNVYTGQFALNGSVKGKLKYANGDLYEGEFTSGARMGPTGQGTTTTKNGDVYSGNFVWGILGGKVLIKYVSGDIYEGGFDNGKRTGQGIYTYKNGNYYSGEWKDGKPHGSGKQYVKASNAMREGIWKDGVYVGKQ